MRPIYLIAAIIGFALPAYFLADFFIEQGPAPRLFLQQLFANRISSAFGLDLIVSSLVFWPFL